MADLTVYLLREDITDPDDAVDGGPAKHPVEEGGVTLGTLFVKPRPAKQPKWVKLFDGYVAGADLGSTQSTGALYIVQASGRLFALAFGLGRHLLKPGVVEERFGLLVVLNAAGTKDFRSVDKRSFDTVDQNSRIQTSQNSPPAEFGIDVEKDLVRGITARLDSDELGTRLTGSDALTVATKVGLKDLPPLLAKYLALFHSTDYKANFDWVDNIRQLTARSHEHPQLEAAMLAVMEQARAGNPAPGCWMAIPNIIDWARVRRFRYSTRAKAGSYADIHLKDFLASVPADERITIELFKRRKVVAIDDDETPVEAWQAYQCIHCEVELDGKNYILSGGNWFHVSQDFVQEVNDYIAAIPAYGGALIDYMHKDEGDYNEALVASDAARFALMDRKNIPVGGIHDKVEFCDAYTADRHIIHVKRYGGSSLLGHLFNQGLVSGTLLRDDKDFVAKVNAKLPATHQLDDGDGSPRDVSGYTIVFAIISDAPGALTIPFFARVALRHARKQLANLNYPHIQLAKILVEAGFAKTAKVAPKKAAAKKAEKKPAAKKAAPAP